MLYQLLNHLVGEGEQRRRNVEAGTYPIAWSTSRRLRSQARTGYSNQGSAFQSSCERARLRVAWFLAGRGHARMPLGGRTPWREKRFGTFDNRDMAARTTGPALVTTCISVAGNDQGDRDNDGSGKFRCNRSHSALSRVCPDFHPRTKLAGNLDYMCLAQSCVRGTATFKTRLDNGQRLVWRYAAI